MSSALSTAGRIFKWFTWLPIAVLVEHRFVTVKRIDGRSMSPTFNPDPSPTRDIVLFNRCPINIPQWDPPLERGDVVYLISPTDPSTLLVKRIIAFEGDTVRTRSEELVKVPPYHVWVEGDEPLGRDSNAFGPVSRALVQGRAMCIVWPPSRIGAIPAAEESGDAWSVSRRLAARERARSGRVTIASSSR